jgi:cobalt/nickel transport system permease protein
VFIRLEDRYRHGTSLVHRLDPRTKLLAAIIFILTVSLTPFGHFAAYALLLAYVLMAATLAGVGAGYVLRRSVVALPFALAAVALPFTVPGEPLATLPIFGGIHISDAGTVRFVSILIKSSISVQMAILLVAVTSFPDLLWGLRALRVPEPLVAITGFMYRYLFVLLDEASRLLRARASRSASIDGQRSGGSLVWRGKVAGRMVGSLMLRSLERSERIYQAMTARGYTGEMRVLTIPRLRREDAFVLCAVIASLLVVLWLPLE